MKKNKSIFRCLILLLLFVMNEALMAQESAIYAGGPVYYHRDYAIDELRNSGFTTVIVWTIHIQANGDLTFNGEFPLVENGVYVGDQLYPNFPDDIAMLKTAPTSITRVEFGLSAAGSGTFAAVQDFYNSEGFGPGTTLYENFSALKNAIPDIDAFNNDDESTYHVASAVAFTKMLAELGFKNAIVPYTNSGFWSALVSQVNADYPGNIDRNYLQCYAGGSGNNPCSPSWDFGIPVYPGMWGGPGHSSTASVENQMNSWQNNCGITGGFMWIYDDFDNSPNVAAYAAAINNALAPAGAPGNASAPNPPNGTTDVNTGTTLTWTAGSGAASHDVYFGTDPALGPSDFQGNQPTTSFVPGMLNVNTTYYWRVDEVNLAGTTTGAVWSFTTAATIAIDHTDPVGTGTITARAAIHAGEGADRAFDNLYTNGTQNTDWSKWLDNGGVPGAADPSWIQIQLPASVIVDQLVMISGNDEPGRDPEDFNIQGSNDGISWTTLGNWSGETWASRFQQREFSFTNTEYYTHYRINITKNNNNINMTQICEIQLLGPQGTANDNPPGVASSPNPADGAVNTDLSLSLNWTAGSGATSHDVYFGTSANPPFVGNQGGTSYSTGVISPNTTYYWRIDEVNAHGTTTGAVWSFTTGSGSECTDCIDFNAVTIASYSNQDANGTYYIEDGGATAHLVNNTWKRTTQTYTITANTVVEFEFMSTAQGEIHGIGFDENNSLSSNRIFKVHGTQNWGIGTYDNYSTIGNYTTYTIPVGSFYTGNAMYLILVNDNDSGSGNNSYFRNIRIYEDTGAKMIAANAVQTILDEPDDEPMEVSGTPLAVYPNPFTDHITLRLPVDHEFTRIRMFDSSGRLVLDRRIKPGTEVLNSDKLQNAGKGIYLLRLENEEHTLTYKLLKK